MRGVFFDAGNTVVFPDYRIYVDIASALGRDVSLDQVRRAEARARGAFDSAVASSEGRDVDGFWPIYYTPFYEHLGLAGESGRRAIEMTRDANDEGFGIWRVPVEGLESTVEELRGRGLKVGIISNSDGRLDARLAGIGIRDLFDFVIDSAVVGVSKPSPRIFEMAVEESGVPPEEAAYVGDYYEVDVVGSRGAGMRPVLFDPVGAYGEVDCETIDEFSRILELVDAWQVR
ncbi:MAG: HAD-IA family hydrolase [Candidatus Eisenbacteria bacterium]|nr:HAD-IA family hydrolase [Candidatus Eisenbacteria bacterium]